MCISLWFCLVSIRSSWRIRRKSRRKRSRLDGTTSSGQPDTEKSSVREDQRSDERPHQANLPHAVPERPRSQRGSAREPPVIIGDPTDAEILAQENRRRTSSRMSSRPIEDTSPRSSRHSIRRSIHGPSDIPSRNPLDLRVIPMIPQEDSEDILLTTSPYGLRSRSPSKSRPHSYPHAPTHLPHLHTIFQP